MPEIRKFYFCYDHNTPTGGQYETYRHVDILNSNGHTAYAVHETPGFRLSWFENDTRVIDLNAFKSMRRDSDIFVVPEDLGSDLLKFPGRKVIFNKNAFHGFACLGLQAPDIYPYHHPEVIGVLVMSEHNRALLQFAFPELNTYLVQSGISQSTFAYVPLELKRNEIAFVAKSPNMLRAVLHTLWARSRASQNALSTFETTVIQGVTMSVEAQILKRSACFVFLNLEEGRPRMVLEAMSTGCIVPGFTGGAMDGCILPELRCAPGDIVGIVSILERFCATRTSEYRRWTELSRLGREWALRFSQENEERSVLKAWESISQRI